MKLILASDNAHKLQEFRKLIGKQHAERHASDYAQYPYYGVAYPLCRACYRSDQNNKAHRTVYHPPFDIHTDILPHYQQVGHGLATGTDPLAILL